MIIGYTTGVFDLFHVGHVNLLQNCKKHCDYLIVGVNSDDLVMGYKKRIPVCNGEDRLKVLSAIRYVDQAFLREKSDDPRLEWEELRYHKRFVGSDWKGSERFNLVERALAPVGSEVIYLPYTEGISTTILRQRRAG